MNYLFIENLKKRLCGELPGKPAQDIMRVRPHIAPSELLTPKDYKPAAVLILLYPLNDDWFFYLTKRTYNVDHHKGQIALPGGLIEKHETKHQAAKRETFEEIGVPENKITIIGSLTSLLIPVSKFEIFPFVGWLPKQKKLKTQTTEVDSVFSISVKKLLLEETKQEKSKFSSGSSIIIPYFDLENEVVWGATSMILSEFKFVLMRCL